MKEREGGLMRKRWFMVFFCAVCLVFAQVSQAATREELANIKVTKAGDFQYWSSSSPAKAALLQYVEDVTNEKSPDFIPEADRIAVFDVDGTLMCETAPSYFDEMMYLDRIFHDTSWQIPADMQAEANEVRKTVEGKPAAAISDDMAEMYQMNAFAGMTLKDYDAYVKKFMQTPEEGLSNLKRGEAFYLPMVEVVSYLVSQNFKVYLVSGGDRQTLRVLTHGILPVEPEHIIGSDAWVRASHQGDTDGLEYVFSRQDELVRGKYLQETTAMNKVSLIARQIGRQPVLAFGNSGGDTSMLNYTVQKNKYKSAAFVLLCDDLDREFGNLKKAEKMQKRAADNGWISVSMKNEYKTIYGNNVKCAK